MRINIWCMFFNKSGNKSNENMKNLLKTFLKRTDFHVTLKIPLNRPAFIRSISASSPFC